jgi:hypothetical protein
MVGSHTLVVVVVVLAKMCGRFAEYESSDTGDGVCSMECKLNQLAMLRRASRSSGLAQPAAKKHRLERLPAEATVLATALHGHGLHSVAVSKTASAGGRRLLYTGGAGGSWRIWDVVTSAGSGGGGNPLSRNSTSARCRSLAAAALPASGATVHAVKLLPNSRAILACDSDLLCVVDLAGAEPAVIASLTSPQSVRHSLAPFLLNRNCAAGVFFLHFSGSRVLCFFFRAAPGPHGPQWRWRLKPLTIPLLSCCQIRL